MMILNKKWQTQQGAAHAWKHRFFCPFLVTSFGQTKEVRKKTSYKAS
jgi:hypothetical protein